MSYIYGICKFGGKVDPEQAGKLKHALNRGVIDDVGQWSNQEMIMGNLLIHNTPDSLQEELPFYFSESGLCITSDARIDNRDELINLLSIDKKHIPDSQIILAAYRKWGTRCVNRLRGDFAFAIWDEGEKQLFLARDIVGIKSLYYVNHPDQFLFATSLMAVIKGYQGNLKFNEEWLKYYLLDIPHKNGSTIYSDIYQLEPAHCLTIRNSRLNKSNYFNFDPNKEIRLKDSREYNEAFREKFDEAVKVRMRSAFNIGSELSGGLDSSAISSLANRFHSKKNDGMITFSNVMEDDDVGRIRPYKDERQYIAQLLDFTSIKTNYSISIANENYLDLINEHINWYGSPAHSTGVYGVSSGNLYKAAQKNDVRTILSGYGGDEIVTSQVVGHRAEMLKRFQLIDYYRFISDQAKIQKHSIFKFLPSALYGDLIGRWIRFNKNLSHRESMRVKYLNEDFMYGTNIRELNVELTNWRLAENVRKGQIQWFNLGYIPQRTETSGLFASKYGIEFRYPMLDVPLMEFVLSLPLSQKANHGYKRFIFRNSMEGVLPEGIRWRKDKSGSIVPSMRRMLMQNEGRILQFVRNHSKGSDLCQYFNIPLILNDLQDLSINENNLSSKRLFKVIDKWLWLELWNSSSIHNRKIL